MKTRTIVSLSIIGLGLLFGVLIVILVSIGIIGLGKEVSNSLLLIISVPLVLIGIFLLFSYVSSSLIMIGTIILLAGSHVGAGACDSFHCYYSLFISSFGDFGLIVFFIGLIYGIIEGTIKLIKKHRNNS